MKKGGYRGSVMQNIFLMKTREAILNDIKNCDVSGPAAEVLADYMEKLQREAYNKAISDVAMRAESVSEVTMQLDPYLLLDLKK